MIGRIDPGQVLAVCIPLTIALSVYLSGKRLAVGWLVGLLVQVLNATYAIVTEHWGWLIGPLLIGPMFAKNWLAWRKQDRQAESLQSTGRHHREPDHRPAATIGGDQ